MGFETSGKLYKAGETQTKGARGFKVREFVLELGGDGKYPQYVQFQLTGDRCENLNDFSENDEVKVEFSLRGREWTSPQGDVKFFNSLDVWQIERVGGGGGGGGGGSDPFGDPPPFDEGGGPPPDPGDSVPF